MALYTVGSVTANNGSAFITGVGGTLWLANIAVNDQIQVLSDPGIYTVLNVIADNSIQLTVPYAGTDVVAASYQAFTSNLTSLGIPQLPLGTRLPNEIVSEAIRRINNLLATGANPFDQDLNTTDHAQFTGISIGNSDSGFALDVATGAGANARIINDAPARNFLRITETGGADIERDLAGVYYNIGSTDVSNFQGFLTFLTTAAAGALLERMRIDASGNVTIGATDGTHPFSIGSLGTRLNPGDGILVASYGQGNSIWRLGANTNFNSAIQFGDPDDGDVGGIQYFHNGDGMQFFTNAGERMRLTSTGRLGINETVPQADLHVTNATQPVLLLDRSSSPVDQRSTILFDNGVGFNFGYVNDDFSLGEIGYQMTRGGGIAVSGHEFSTSGTLRAAITDQGLAVGTTTPLSSSSFSSQQVGNLSGFVIECTNAGYTSFCANIRTVRAADAGFYFLACQSSSSADNEFLLRGDGNAFADGTWTGGGADYAEYFEWLDGNPNGEDRAGWSVVLEGKKVRRALAGEKPIGVMSANASVVGDAAWDRWSEKYLRDDFGRYMQEEYESVSWKALEEVPESEEVHDCDEIPITETKIVVEDGKAIQETVETIRKDPKFDKLPMFYKGGEPIMERVFNGEYTAEGEPILVEQQKYHFEPIMKTIAKISIKEVEHSYAEDEIPEGLKVPDDAERAVQQRRVLNPNYDPDTPYIPRADRPEWDTIGMMGKLRILKGEETAPHWIKMRDISGKVEEWLIPAG